MDNRRHCSLPDLGAELAPGRPRKSGLWALLRLDGAPLEEVDCQALGFPACSLATNGYAAGFERGTPHLVRRRQDAEGLTVLVGRVSDEPGLAAQLGLSGSTATIDLVRAAQRRYGARLATEMVGDWTLLHCDSSGAITVSLAATRRDGLLYALSGSHLAVCPDLFALERLDWVDNEIDPTGLLTRLGRARLRQAEGWHSMLRGIRQIPAGGTLTISPRGAVRFDIADALTPQPQFTGDAAEFIEATEALLRQIMREELAGHSHATILLSGGLDSSLLAWLAHEEAVPGQTVDAITSVAPEGSAIPDERDFAGLVANHLALPLHQAAPDSKANPYLPPPHVLSGGGGPLLGNRHCLTEAFQQLARGHGATVLVNGTYGEMSVTGRYPPAFGPKVILQQLVRTLRPRPAENISDEPCHVRLSRHCLANWPEELRGYRVHSNNDGPLSSSDGRGTYLPGCDKALAHINAFHAEALRMAFPFRDLRLMRLFASAPLKLLQNIGHDRGAARTILLDRLPDAIRLRRSGLPADPGHMRRLQHFAGPTRARLPAFRKAEADEWLDLEWLDMALARIAAQGPSNVADANRVQLTAMAAEFFCWWRHTGEAFS